MSGHIKHLRMYNEQMHQERSGGCVPTSSLASSSALLPALHVRLASYIVRMVALCGCQTSHKCVGG